MCAQLRGPHPVKASCKNDADRVREAASHPQPQGLYQSQLEVFLNPNDPAVCQSEAERKRAFRGMSREAARRSIRATGGGLEVGPAAASRIPTLPMVYVPPTSSSRSGGAEDAKDLTDADPVRYLANPWRRAMRSWGALGAFPSARHAPPHAGRSIPVHGFRAVPVPSAHPDTSGELPMLV